MTDLLKSLRKIMKKEQEIANFYHIDYGKLLKQQYNEIHDFLRRTTSKFSDKDMDSAMKLLMLIHDKMTPADGVTYAEAWLILFTEWDNETKDLKSYDVPDNLEQNIDNVIYVAQTLSFEMTFGAPPSDLNTPIGLAPLPIIRSVKIQTKDLPILPYEVSIHDWIETPVIFNGGQKKYFLEFTNDENNNRVIQEFHQWLKTHTKRYRLPSDTPEDET